MEVTSKGDCDGDSVPNDVEVEIDSTDDRDPCIQCSKSCY